MTAPRVTDCPDRLAHFAAETRLDRLASATASAFKPVRLDTLGGRSRASPRWLRSP